VKTQSHIGCVCAVTNEKPLYKRMRSLRDLGLAALRRRWVNIVVTSTIKLYLFCCIQENIIARNRSKSLEEFPLDATLLCISRWAQRFCFNTQLPGAIYESRGEYSNFKCCFQCCLDAATSPFKLE
jgi:hypothetical protein